jgi:hypothetical protein
MLRVRIDIVPWGHEPLATTLSELFIYNKGEAGAGGMYEYGVIEMDREKGKGGLVDGNLLHMRAEGYWPLVEQAISRFKKGFD